MTVTNLELETAILVSRGKTTKEIAALHGVAVGTVKMRLENLYRKLSFQTENPKVELATWVTRELRCLRH